MPISKYNELLQDYVCSCVMRVGRELLALLPDDIVIVTAVDALLNSATGHVEDLPVLSVVFSGQTLSRLNVEDVDPSEAMKNFTHNMVFKKPPVSHRFSGSNHLHRIAYKRQHQRQIVHRLLSSASTGATIYDQRPARKPCLPSEHSVEQACFPE